MLKKRMSKLKLKAKSFKVGTNAHAFIENVIESQEKAALSYSTSEWTSKCEEADASCCSFFISLADGSDDTDQVEVNAFQC